MQRNSLKKKHENKFHKMIISILVDVLQKNHYNKYLKMLINPKVLIFKENRKAEGKNDLLLQIFYNTWSTTFCKSSFFWKNWVIEGNFQSVNEHFVSLFTFLSSFIYGQYFFYINFDFINQLKSELTLLLFDNTFFL